MSIVVIKHRETIPIVFVDIDIIKPTIHFEQLIWLDKFEQLIEYNKIDYYNFLLPIGCDIFDWSVKKVLCWIWLLP